MSVSRVTAKNSKAEFWRVVVECLREFHKIAADEARRKADHYRNRIKQLPRGAARLLYHLEPFDVACDIARRPLKLTKNRLVRYLQIRDQPRDEDLPKRAIRKLAK